MQKSYDISVPKTLTPLQQGSDDNLCGLYTAINAIRLVDEHAPSRKSLSKLLMTTGVEFLERKGWLHGALLDGLSVSRQRKLTNYLLKTYNNQYGAELTRTAFTATFLDFDQFIEFQLWEGRPVCVCFSGAINHYSIITGMSSKKVSLFDSEDRAWLKRSHVAFATNSKSALYGIYPRSVYSIGFCADPAIET